MRLDTLVIDCHDKHALGATVAADVEDFGVRWRTLRDPEGNLVCLVPHLTG